MMQTKKSKIMLLCFLSLFFLLSVSTATATTDPLFHSCNSTNNSAIGILETNRLTTILANTAPPIGFGIGSVGRGRSKTYGLALCRGDVDSYSCRTCIRGAGAGIRRLCPRKKEAVVWLENCLLRYSDAEFFGEVDEEHGFFLRSAMTGEAEAATEAEITETMDWVRRKAYLSPLLFATRAKGNVYGMAQCSRDLSGGDCNRCLKKAVGELGVCCGGGRGGRVVGGSCYVRYELYPFFHA